MLKCFSNQTVGNHEINVLIYVYNRVIENVADDLIVINEVFESNYFALSKRISSSSLDVYLHFQSGDQVFRNIKKYFEITQSVHHRWLDVIKAAIELDISLSIEENLLSSSLSNDQPTNSLIKLSHGLWDTTNEEMENRLIELAIIIPIRLSLLEEKIQNLLQKSAETKHFALMYPEIVVQQFNFDNENVDQKANIKNITISDSSHLNMLIGHSPSMCKFQIFDSNIKKTHLFTTSQHLMRATHTYLSPLKSSNDNNIDEKELKLPDSHFPSIETSDSTFIKLSCSTPANCFNEQFSNLRLSPDFTNMEYTTCGGDAGKDVFRNAIDFLLPINHLSDSQGKVNQIQIGQVRHISLFSCQVKNEITQNLSTKSCSTTESISNYNPSIKEIRNSQTHESLQDITLNETDEISYSFETFIPEQLDIEHLSNSFVLISNFNFIYNNLGILIPSPFSALLLSLSIEQLCFNQCQLVRFIENESLQLISELSEMGSNFSICSNNTLNEIHFQYWSIKNSKDIGYMSYFRSFTIPTQQIILRNRNCLPCSKDLRLFSTSFQRFQCTSSVPTNYQSIFYQNCFADPVKQLMNRENQDLQSKYFAFPQQMIKQTGNLLLKSIGTHQLQISPNNLLDILYKYFLEIFITSIVNEYFNNLRINVKTNNALDRYKMKQDENRNYESNLFPQHKSQFYLEPSYDMFREILKRIPLVDYDKMKGPEQDNPVLSTDNYTKTLSLSDTTGEINEELRCLNLIVYFLEELFDIWTENMVSITDVQNILHRLFSQLKTILLSISEKKNIDKLTEIGTSCIDDIESTLNYAFDPICILIFLKSIIHKLNMFGKYILSYSIIPMTLKHSLFRLYLRYKTILQNRKQMKLHTCLIEVYSKPEILQSLFSNSASDRRIKCIEKKSNCCMVMQPLSSLDAHKRLIKVYCTSNDKGLNVQPLLSMITRALNKPYNKIQIISVQSLTESRDKCCENDLRNLGDVRWSNFRFL